MAENQDTLGDLEKLALIAESIQNTFQGKGTIVFELKSEEYTSVISHFREIDRHHKQFSIDISGTEFHFILDEGES
jgi:flagellar basal body P-ring protein FlgI